MLFFSVAASLHCRPTFANAWLEKNRQCWDWKIFWDFCWWCAYWRSRWLLNTGQWSKNPLYSTPLFGSVMSWNRFQLLLSMLHFTNNTQQPSHDDPLRDKLFKHRPVEWWIICLNECIDESLLLWNFKFISNNTFRWSALVLVWSCSSCVRAVADIFTALTFMLAKTTCFNFRQAYHNHWLSLDQLNALCGSWCCQFWRKDIIFTWTIITPAFHCLPHFWWHVAEIWPALIH